MSEVNHILRGVSPTVNHQLKASMTLSHFIKSSSVILDCILDVPTANPPYWILASGFWDDNGVWMDDKFWID